MVFLISQALDYILCRWSNQILNIVLTAIFIDRTQNATKLVTLDPSVLCKRKKLLGHVVKSRRNYPHTQIQTNRVFGTLNNDGMSKLKTALKITLFPTSPDIQESSWTCSYPKSSLISSSSSWGKENARYYILWFCVENGDKKLSVCFKHLAKK